MQIRYLATEYCFGEVDKNGMYLHTVLAGVNSF
jgi:hypothetical protein